MSAASRLVEQGVTLACVLGIAFGQILFRVGAQQIDAQRLVRTTVGNGALIAALVVYAVATASWIHVLRTAPLHRVYPLFALGFVIVPVLEHLLLGTALRWQSLAGGAVIVVGVLLAVSNTQA